MLPVERKRPVFERETDAVSGMRVPIVPKYQTTMPPHLLGQPYHEVEVCLGREVSEAKVTMGPFFGHPCRYYLRGSCTRTSCENWHPPECPFFLKNYKVDEQPF